MIWRLLRQALLPALLAFFIPLPAARAAMVAEGVYTVSDPQRAVILFRMILTEQGARIVPTPGETLIFSYEQKVVLVLDNPLKGYFILPLEMVPPLLAEGLGYDPRGLGATASGRTKKILGLSCAEVVVSGSSPKFALSTWRVAEASVSREYALLEQSLGLPWTVAKPPAVFLGIPLAGSVEVLGSHPYKASWVINKLTRDENVSEDFTIPAGYRIDVNRLLSLQGGDQRR